MSPPLDQKRESSTLAIDHVVFALDLAGNFRSVNQTAERLTGYSADEFALLNVLDLLPGKCLADLRRLANRCVRRRFGTVFEIAITARNGRQIPVEVSFSLVRGASGSLEFHGIAVAHHDAVSPKFRPRCLDNRFRFIGQYSNFSRSVGDAECGRQPEPFDKIAYEADKCH